MSLTEVDEIRLFHATYQGALDEFKENGWHIEQQTITHRDKRVSTYKLEKGYTGKILQIVNPHGHRLIMCGVNNSGIKIADFVKAPHLFPIPHQFSILCYDDNDRELSPETLIRIEKITPSRAVFTEGTVLYRDMALKSGERLKRKEERYYFPRGIFLFGGESLFLAPIQPDITIVRTELFMKCDYLTTEGKLV